MNAIFRMNHIYVVVRNKEVREGIDIKDSPDVIINNEDKTHVSLYADRVRITLTDRLYGYYKIFVDGIEIHDNFQTTNLPIERIAVILNQIEFLGVDAYLNRYVKQLEKYKLELKIIANEILHDSTNNENNEKLESLRNTIIKIESLLFSLYNNENIYVKDVDCETAYIAIVNKYF